MKKVLFVALFFWGLNSSATPTGVSPWNCPAEIEFKADRIDEEVEAYIAKGEIRTALELARQCANWGSSLDPRILAPAVSAMMDVLIPVLPTDAKAQMDTMIDRCVKRGQGEGGTLGQSVGAHCVANVVVGFYSAYKE